MGDEAIEGVTGDEVQPPLWLEAGKEREDQPEQIKVLYKKLKPAETLACERGRERMRMGYGEYLRGLEDVRDALKPSKKFKQWCEAWGLNYGTACNALSLAAKRAQRASLAATAATETNVLVSSAPVAEPTPLPKSRKTQLIITLDDETLAGVKSGLKQVLDSQEAYRGTNEWGQGVVILLDFWYAHHAQEQEQAS